MSKRRRGFPSETAVKRGARVVHGDKELLEKLGRKDLCPCGSGLRFQAVLPPLLAEGWRAALGLLSASEGGAPALDSHIGTPKQQATADQHWRIAP